VAVVGLAAGLGFDLTRLSFVLSSVFRASLGGWLFSVMFFIEFLARLYFWVFVGWFWVFGCTLFCRRCLLEVL
jgi:hypothetical protein